MNTRRFIWALLPLLFLGCEDDTTTPVPPAPLTPDQQVVANCRALRDALENFATNHDGAYPDNPWNFGALGLAPLVNPYSGLADWPEGRRAMFPGEVGYEAYQSCGATPVFLGYRITGYGVDHQLIVLESMENVPADIRYAQDLIMSNAYLVADAARRWAAANDGEYPIDAFGDSGSDGNTLVDLLPNGELLFNPIYGTKDNPVDGSAAAEGQVGYTPISSSDGVTRAFVVDGMGCLGMQILLIRTYLLPDEITDGQCYELRAAIERFQTAAGTYPHNLDVETTPGGKTVFDYYFGNASETERFLVNPYTQEHFVPFIGAATNRGEIAYQPIVTDGVVTDYVVTGMGLFEEITHLGPRPID